MAIDRIVITTDGDTIEAREFGKGMVSRDILQYKPQTRATPAITGACTLRGVSGCSVSRDQA